MQVYSSRAQSAFSQNINIEVYMKLIHGVRICADISLLDLTSSCVSTKPREKDSVS